MIKKIRKNLLALYCFLKYYERKSNRHNINEMNYEMFLRIRLICTHWKIEYANKVLEAENWRLIVRLSILQSWISGIVSGILEILKGTIPGRWAVLPSMWNYVRSRVVWNSQGRRFLNRGSFLGRKGIVVALLSTALCNREYWIASP